MIFIKLLIELLLKKNELNKIIRNDFFNQHTFSLPNSSKNDVLIGLRQFKRFLFKVWISEPDKSDYFLNGEKGVYMYDIRPCDLVEKSNYIFKEDNVKISGGLFRDNLLTSLPIIKRIFYSILATKLYFITSFIVFFKKKSRTNIALFPELSIECSILVHKLKNLNCKKIYFFSTHEPEANLLAHLMMKNDIRVVKIPNTNPLFMFNKSIVADELVLTLEYQHEEANLFYENCDFIIKSWKPHGLINYKRNSKNKESNNKVCYYSHGSWYRKNEDHNLPQFNDVDLELNFLKMASSSSFLRNIDIYVCLHPKEKSSNEVLEKSVAYFQNIFGTNVKFFDFQKKSLHSFKEFELGIGAFSSILFERIYCGYKTIIFNDKIDEFPIIDSNFSQFVFSKEDYFNAKIQESLNSSHTDFFGKNMKYTFDEFIG